MDIRKGVDIGDDRLTASIEQPVLITRCVFHTLLQKDTGGSRDTHGTHTGHAGAQLGAQGHTDHTDEPHNHPNSPTLAQGLARHTNAQVSTPVPARQPDGRNRGRHNSRRPGANSVSNNHWSRGDNRVVGHRQFSEQSNCVVNRSCNVPVQ